MESKEIVGQPNLIELTAEVVAAFVMHNSVQKADIPDLIASVHSSLQQLGHPKPAEPARPTPAVPIKKSVSPDYIISLEDGRRYKSLKRHLSGRGLTPERYREKWGLSPDYPMVAPNYAKQRSELAKSMGLGRQRKRDVPPTSGKGKRTRNAA